MNVSIVIPVYNEEGQLDACLKAIARQTVQPFEVIVVDNNSDDDSAALASRYKFVTLLHEPRQGVVHARTSGFDIAKGEIIARIDADSLLPVDWVANVQHVFTDSRVQATSGIAEYYGVAGASFVNSVDLFFRRRLEHQLADAVYLWGANMAIRKSAWRQIRSQLCMRGDLHEDFDIALHLQDAGGLVTFDERLRAGVSSRRIDVPYVDFMRYVMVSPKTYAEHGIRQRWHMYGVVLACALGYIPGRVLYRGYDSQQQRFSLRQLFRPPQLAARVDPTTNVVSITDY